jgi:hypothetical protein
MSSRLQVLIPPGLDRRLRKAAERARVSKGEFVRRAIERALADPHDAPDPLARLAGLGAPTGDIDQVLAEIEAGRG